MNKLLKDSIAAEVESLTSLLQDVPADDEISHFQLSKRLEALQKEFQRVSDAPSTTASLAMLFSGKPVIGSKAIDADFAAKAIYYMQTLITKQAASKQVGQLATHGPITFSRHSAMGITGVAHHSFGFVLEEMPENDSLIETPLNFVVNEIVNLIAKSGAENLDEFETAIGDTDPRQLPTLRELFRLLDDRGARLTLVDDTQEEYLDDQAIHRARQRVESIEVNDLENQEISGLVLGILPEARRFELKLDETGEIIHGAVNAKFSNEYLEKLTSVHEDVVGRRWRVLTRIREIKEPNRPTRRIYTLQGLIRALGQ